jgi:hypothetical protein
MVSKTEASARMIIALKQGGRPGKETAAPPKEDADRDPHEHHHRFLCIALFRLDLEREADGIDPAYHPESHCGAEWKTNIRYDESFGTREFPPKSG